MLILLASLVYISEIAYFFISASFYHCNTKMSRQPASGGTRKISFNVSDQYDIQDVVGEGAYGVVWYGATREGARSVSGC
jgi:hypothetical protein